MKVLLTTLNSKFIHSNLAIRYLKAYYKDFSEEIITKEFSINDNLEYIMAGIYNEHPDVVALSCYIWNINETLLIAETLKKVLPNCYIILGGPEVSYESKELMEEHPAIDCIIRGEGEITFAHLMDSLFYEKSLSDIEGITFRQGNSITCNPDRPLIKDLDSIPFPYADGFKGLENKILYYETSRGCPFECQYCLSSITHGVRYFSLDRVREDIQIFIDAGIPQVKLVDRTFNCNPKRAREIFSMIMDMGGNTNFHFEICGDLLDEETLELLKQSPPGLFQFEIGVQSTHEKTLDSIRRKTDFEKLAYKVQIIGGYRNIHLHLDLIAGLPDESYSSFGRSFNDVYSLKPNRIQLGFLKFLKGSGLRNNADKWGYEFTSYSPYEVLNNQDISFGELLKLKSIEDLVEKYYNTHRFEYALTYMEEILDKDFFKLYEKFAKFYEEQGYGGLSYSLMQQYEIILEFAMALPGIDKDLFKTLLRFDYVSHGKPSRYPKGLEPKEDEEQLKEIQEFFRNPDNITKHLPHLKEYTGKQISRRAHIEIFQYDILRNRDMVKIPKEKSIILFDYDIPLKLFERSRCISINSL